MTTYEFFYPSSNSSLFYVKRDVYKCFPYFIDTLLLKTVYDVSGSLVPIVVVTPCVQLEYMVDDST